MMQSSYFDITSCQELLHALLTFDARASLSNYEILINEELEWM